MKRVKSVVADSNSRRFSKEDVQSLIVNSSICRGIECDECVFVRGDRCLLRERFIEAVEDKFK